MPAVNFNLYDQFRLKQNDGSGVNFSSDLLKVAIVTAVYTPDQNLHDFWDDVSANEVSGT